MLGEEPRVRPYFSAEALFSFERLPVPGHDSWPESDSCIGRKVLAVDPGTTEVCRQKVGGHTSPGHLMQSSSLLPHQEGSVLLDPITHSLAALELREYDSKLLPLRMLSLCFRSVLA